MSKFDRDFGPWIDYGNGDKDNEIKGKMAELAEAEWSPFNGYDYAQIFIFCMAYSFAQGKKPKPIPKRKGSMPSSAFREDMRDFMKIVAIAHTNNLEIITKANEVVRICEDYAYASFLEVYDRIKNRSITSSNETSLDEMLHEIEEKRVRN